MQLMVGAGGDGAQVGRKKCERVNYMASPILAGKRTTRQDKPIAGWLRRAVDAVRVRSRSRREQAATEPGKGRGRGQEGVEE